MPHPKDNELFPIDTVVRIRKTGEFAIIKDQVFLSDFNRNFLHYRGIIDGRGESMWVLYHDDIELENLPPEKP
jgi:hypothetical protein